MARARAMQKHHSWAIDVTSNLKGADFPLDREAAEDRLRGVQIEGKDASYYLEKIDFPVDNPTELMGEISDQVEAEGGGRASSSRAGGARVATGRGGRGRMNWPIQVASRTGSMEFPLQKEEAKDKLKGIEVNGKDITEILDRLHYPIDSPADLVHEISENE